MEDRHDRRLAILVHKNPDNDALGSAILVKAWYIHEHGFRPENISICGDLDFAYLYRDILSGENVHSVLDDTWTDYEVVVVDTPTPRFLDKEHRPILKGANKVTIYDHHIDTEAAFRSAVPENIELHSHVDPRAESCSQYIYSLMSQDMRRTLSTAQLNACLMGMYSDTHGFMRSSQETLDIAQELIKLGASIKCITHCANRELGIWGKLKYLGKVPENIMWLKESKIAIIKTSFTDYSTSNRSIDKSPMHNRAPLYILGILRRERLKYCKTIHAYLLVYDREWVNNKARYTLVLDLIKWSPERQLKLKELGFPVFRDKQDRYYMSVCQRKYFGMCKDIDRVLIETHSDDLIDLYDGENDRV